MSGGAQVHAHACKHAASVQLSVESMLSLPLTKHSQNTHLSHTLHLASHGHVDLLAAVLNDEASDDGCVNGGLQLDVLGACVIREGVYVRV